MLQKRNMEQPFEKASEAKAFIKEQFGHEFHLHWVQKLIVNQSITDFFY